LFILFVFSVGLSILSNTSEASEVWFSSGWVYSGRDNDSICDKKGNCITADTRMKPPFEVTWIRDKAYMKFGWFNGRDKLASYTYAGGGVHFQPLPNTSKRLYLQLGFHFGDESVSSDRVMRFDITPMLIFNKFWVGWSHTSNARGIANLASDRNKPIEQIKIGYCAAGC